MTSEAILEDAANRLEMAGADGFSEAADFLRRIELERADAARKALDSAIKRIEGLEDSYRNDLYRKAWKVATSALRSMKLGV
jgi:hypothetical protein